VLFERYGDVLVHCKTERQAELMRAAIEKRLVQCKLQLHPEKTHIVYCKDEDRRKEYPLISFDFSASRFSREWQGNKHGRFCFVPSGGQQQGQEQDSQTIKNGVFIVWWTSLEDIVERINPVLRGWYQYWPVYKPALFSVLRNVQRSLIRWAQWKYKGLRNHMRNARRFSDVRKRTPGLCALAAWLRV
jgi:RNA-directed DNA polymerase